MADSPLAQVSPTSLETLFNTDPATFTGPDDPRVIEIVNALRADRARWVENEKKPKKEKIAAAANLKIEDLDL